MAADGGVCLQAADYRIQAEKYAATMEENRRLYNEVQDLKGNIRVFCRIRPLGATGDYSQGTPLKWTLTCTDYQDAQAC